MKDKLKTRYKVKSKGRIKAASYFDLWISTDKNKCVSYQVSKTGYSFSIDTQHKQIFINGHYHYFTEDEFNKFWRDLRRLVRKCQSEGFRRVIVGVDFVNLQESDAVFIGLLSEQNDKIKDLIKRPNQKGKLK